MGRLFLEGGFIHRWQTCQPLSQFQRLHRLMSLATTPLSISLATETIWWGSFEEVAHPSCPQRTSLLTLTSPLHWKEHS